MTKQLFLTGVSLVSYGYRAGRDVRWYLRRRFDRP